MKRIAYIRVSTCEQRPDRQIDGLREICDELHIEKISATSKYRPVYEDVIRRLKQGDVLVVWTLCRAYRSTREALNEIERLRSRNISIHIASMNIDTDSPYGRLLYTFITALAEFERDILSERTKEGLAAARKRGKRLGRPCKLTEPQLKEAVILRSRFSRTYKSIGHEFGVSGWTLSRAIKRFHKQEDRLDR